MGESWLIFSALPSKRVRKNWRTDFRLSQNHSHLTVQLGIQICNISSGWYETSPACSNVFGLMCPSLKNKADRTLEWDRVEGFFVWKLWSESLEKWSGIPSAKLFHPRIKRTVKHNHWNLEKQPQLDCSWGPRVPVQRWCYAGCPCKVRTIGTSIWLLFPASLQKKKKINGKRVWGHTVSIWGKW